MIETQKKKITNTVWKESLGRKELLEMKTNKDFTKIARREHVGDISAESIYMIDIAQDDDRFSRSTEDDVKTYCWKCSVKVIMVEKSLCSGCLRARYCSQECLVADWGVHGEWCQRRKGGSKSNGHMLESGGF